METKKTSYIVPLLLKLMLLAAGVVGQIYTFGGSNFMASALPLYYTNQSNWWIMAITAVFVVYDIMRLSKREIAPPDWLIKIKFTFTVAITLTFVVFSLMLTPQMLLEGGGAYLTSVSNLCVHNLVPILAIADWFLDAYSFNAKKNTYLLGAIMPLYYLAFALICSFSGVDFGGGSKVPYFFLDYEASGWFSLSNGRFGVAWWIIILVAAVLLMSRLFASLKLRVCGRGKAAQ